MRKILLILMSSAILLVGCSSIKLNPGAQKVIISPNKPPRTCKYIGQVAGNQGNFFTGAYTSNKNLEVGSMNDIRNKAVQKGANYVQILNSRAGNTGSGGRYGGSFQQTNITNIGNAYKCPPSAINE